MTDSYLKSHFLERDIDTWSQIDCPKKETEGLQLLSSITKLINWIAINQKSESCLQRGVGLY